MDLHLGRVGYCSWYVFSETVSPLSERLSGLEIYLGGFTLKTMSQGSTLPPVQAMLTAKP